MIIKNHFFSVQWNHRRFHIIGLDLLKFYLKFIGSVRLPILFIIKLSMLIIPIPQHILLGWVASGIISLYLIQPQCSDFFALSQYYDVVEKKMKNSIDVPKEQLRSKVFIKGSEDVEIFLLNKSKSKEICETTIADERGYMDCYSEKVLDPFQTKTYKLKDVFIEKRWVYDRTKKSIVADKTV